jgi:ribosomal protein L16/L10AE
LRLASHKLPFPTKMIYKEQAGESAEQ